MPDIKKINVALVGNPNSGKSSLFNQLTGLNQKIGNFPGVTVDKKIGVCRISENLEANIIDLPGTYSLYPKSIDELVVLDFLNSTKDPHFPDIIIVVVDSSNLKRNLLLFTQIADLGFPIVLAMNMLDIALKSGLKINFEELKKELKVPIVTVNGRSGLGLNSLKQILENPMPLQEHNFFDAIEAAPCVVRGIKEKLNIKNNYLALLLSHQHRKNIKSLSSTERSEIEIISAQCNFQSVVLQIKETTDRYLFIDKLLKTAISENKKVKKDPFTDSLDRIVTHPWWGYFTFFALLFIIFQAIFSWATLPMELIDEGFSNLNVYLQSWLPQSQLTNLLTEGLISGLGGIVIFIPQIAILFAFISILEESGYMSRVMFMMDKFMRKFGMNGRSVVPLISGVACAVPAIMATRSIDNWKDRIITIFVTPLMSCSARIPVYTVLIALVIPDVHIMGVLNIQGLALMGLYLLGFFSAIVSGYILHLLLKTKQKSYFIMEFPPYRMPRWKNVLITIVEKVKSFLFEAGKIIIAISIILWVLASYGPSGNMESAEKEAISQAKNSGLSYQETENFIASKKLENSYAGIFGKGLEPVIKPLGFDWKIGIAIITSFAAREVFIGTMSTIYSVGAVNDSTLKEKMLNETNPETGEKMYTPALAFSLLIFYVFAMQCMSTLAVTYRETKSWKWPALQFSYMTGLAYLGSYLIYNILK